MDVALLGVLAVARTPSSAHSHFDFISPPSRTGPPRRCGSDRAGRALPRAPRHGPRGSKTKKQISSSGTWIERSKLTGSAPASAPRRPSAPAARGRRALPPGHGRGRSRRGSSARPRRYDRRRAAETSERLNFAPPAVLSAAGGRARCASARRAWRRCASGGWRPSARRGTARRRPPVRSALGDQSATRCSAGVSPPRACARRSSRARRAPARPRWPPRAARSRRAPRDRLAGRPLLPRAPADDAEGEERAARRRDRRRLVLSNRLLEERIAPIDVSAGGGDEAAAPRDMREHPLAAEPRRVRLPGVDDAHCLVDPAELEQRLDVVGGPRAMAGSNHPSSCAARSRLAEPSRAGRSVSAPQRGQPDDREMKRRLEPELLLARARGPASTCSRARSSWPRWTAIHGDREMVLRISIPYWTRCRAPRAAWSAASSQRPAPSSTSAKLPEGVGAPWLVALPPALVLVLEHTRARRCSRRRRSPRRDRRRAPASASPDRRRSSSASAAEPERPRRR